MMRHFYMYYTHTHIKKMKAKPKKRKIFFFKCYWNSLICKFFRSKFMIGQIQAQKTSDKVLSSIWKNSVSRRKKTKFNRRQNHNFSQREKKNYARKSSNGLNSWNIFVLLFYQTWWKKFHSSLWIQKNLSKAPHSSFKLSLYHNFKDDHSTFYRFLSVTTNEWTHNIRTYKKRMRQIL